MGKSEARLVIVDFSTGASEIFTQLPEPIKRRAARSIELPASNPHMYPVRRRGVMRGYRYFVAYSVLFYYPVFSAEIRIAAIDASRSSSANGSIVGFRGPGIFSAKKRAIAFDR